MKIRASYRDIDDLAATNSQIKATAWRLFGFVPSSQAIQSAIGTEYERKLITLNGSQIEKTKKLCTTEYGGDADLMIEGVYAVKRLNA